MNITDDMFQPAPPTSPFNSSIQSSPGFFPASPGSEYTKMQILLHASPRVQSGTTLYLSLLTCTTIAITVTLARFLHKTNTPFLSPPTLLIFLGLLSQTAYTASSAYFFDNPFSKPGKAINILFFATTLVLYAWQQWTRSHQVFHLTSTPFFLTLFKSILIAFTLLHTYPCSSSPSQSLKTTSS
ncbi:hypothetical protein BCR33DRAFT_762833 [Rhizoclosmatium globosum]|uniref:Uncharacterized protein n=1 Tax=Rhizoclosmatium globosum TaxID=329046 RepID=A0A1Y2CW18_9FUNG|nr:hypothetical protein BCR33DRAFT_762833 [Rhizoclosmatium globosum]|eukprot:ORY50535.1 hypothetical protein BCR33DRAFT_762833 [Rhizoclosmatium globosum]